MRTGSDDQDAGQEDAAHGEELRGAAHGIIVNHPVHDADGGGEGDDADHARETGKTAGRIGCWRLSGLVGVHGEGG